MYILNPHFCRVGKTVLEPTIGVYYQKYHLILISTVINIGESFKYNRISFSTDYKLNVNNISSISFSGHYSILTMFLRGLQQRKLALNVTCAQLKIIEVYYMHTLHFLQLQAVSLICNESLHCFVTVFYSAYWLKGPKTTHTIITFNFT